MTSLLHFKYDESPTQIEGYIFFNDQIIFVQLKSKPIKQRISDAAFEIDIVTNKKVKDANVFLKLQLAKKLEVDDFFNYLFNDNKIFQILAKPDRFSMLKPLRPILWKSPVNKTSKSFNMPFVDE